MRWSKVTLVGVGLLGGSLGMALRQRRVAARVHGYVRREASARECVEVGAVDSASLDLGESVRGADLIVLCTPLAQMKGLALEAQAHLTPGTLVTDVGSVKGQLVADLEPLFSARDASFVGSHPMAGSEKMGVAAARPDLFENAVCVVTPTSRTPETQVVQTEKLWTEVGGKILRLSPEVHDDLVARSSHLPQVLAAHLARYVLNPKRGAEQRMLCAGGFRDSTRVASGSPEMWRDIALMNKTSLRKALREYRDFLGEFDNLLENGEPAAMEQFFSGAKAWRDAWRRECASLPDE